MRAVNALTTRWATAAEDGTVFSGTDARFDRPFGFPAPRRPSRLVVAAGWVTDPLPLPEYFWEDDE
ncbi:hypothetical protein ABZ642_03790 [Streptomyces sp. NPDC007157]|uniref:hypothetical protein n=1 Tax=Streptomyces sp. NPDC007157 TaxID=3154681 RepID=UPI0033F2E70B